jgi:hypothetical protein
MGLKSSGESWKGSFEGKKNCDYKGTIYWHVTPCSLVNIYTKVLEENNVLYAACLLLSTCLVYSH